MILKNIAQLDFRQSKNLLRKRLLMELFSSKVLRYGIYFLVNLLGADCKSITSIGNRFWCCGFLMSTIVKPCSQIRPLSSSFDLTVKRHTKENFYLLDVFNILIVYFRTMVFTSWKTYTDRHQKVFWEISNWYLKKGFFLLLLNQ